MPSLSPSSPSLTFVPTLTFTISLAALRSKLPVPPLTVRRITHGVGVERGRIGVEVVNNLEDEAEVVWGESWPWWLRGYLSTLEATLNGTVSTRASPSP